MKLGKWIALGIFITGLMALNNCKEETPFVHNYKGDWGYCEEFNCFKFSFNDNSSTYMNFIYQAAYNCGYMLDAWSYISVEEYGEGVLKITQDSCFKYEYNIEEFTDCESFIAGIIQCAFEGNIVVDYTFLMRYREFYIKYLVEGDDMKVKYYMNPEEIKPGFDGTVYNFFRVIDDDEHFN